MFFEMRFYLGTLDSGERLLPFGLLVLYFPGLNKLKTNSVGRKFNLLCLNKSISITNDSGYTFT